ncbi:MAG TPA: hypothetical protein VLJ59_07795 [Mycobacteriales bacterium]|nr:hypothetical protein [Mycobacteriales bacterium]
MTEVPPLVSEATRKAGVIWVGVPGQPRAIGVWHQWHDAPPADGVPGGVSYVVIGPGEQPVHGLAAATTCTVSVPSSDKRGRIVTWRAAVSPVRPGTPEWDAVIPGMLTKRLNLAAAATAAERWARQCTVLRLAPTGELAEAGETLPTGSLAEPPPPSPARTATRVPFTLHRKRGGRVR